MAEEEQENQEPSLGVVDIQNCIQIIDVASRRGAFQGNELSQVGQVRDKLNEFVQSVLPQEEETENEEETEPEPEVEKKTTKSNDSSKTRKKK